METQGNIQPEGTPQEQAGGTFTSEEVAAFKQFIEAFEKLDLSKEFKASGASIEIGADGEWVFRPPETEEGKDLLCSALLHPSTPCVVPEEGPQGDSDMGLLDRFKICVFSDVRGVITRDGKPAPGVEVIRMADLFLPKDRVYTDRTVTDAVGHFEFGPIYASKRKPILGEVRTDQRIFLRDGKKEYLGWFNTSSGRELHQDVSGYLYLDTPENYIPLDFYGDLSRGEPLPEDADWSKVQEGGLFNSELVYVCSSLHFFVTMNGKPAVGARVVRTCEHVGYKTYEQSKLTDCDGEIELPMIYARELEHRWAKTEIRQKVVITYEGKDYLAWEKTNTNRWACGEYNVDKTKTIYVPRITAELTDDPNIERGVITDPVLRWKGDVLPDDAIRYRGLFKVVRYDPGMREGND